MTILEKINEDWKESLRNKEELRKTTLSSLRAEFKNLQISKKGKELNDSEIIQVLNKEIKKREEASSIFANLGKEQESEKERQEATIIKAYLPAQLSQAELESIIDDIILETNAQGLSDMGRVMKASIVRVAGKATNDRVSLLIREKLS